MVLYNFLLQDFWQCEQNLYLIVYKKKICSMICLGLVNYIFLSSIM